MRGLTHRAVDRAGGLPEGSCSYYFRTRHALLQAAVDRLAETDTTEGRLRAADPTDPAEVAAVLVRLIQHWIGPARARTLARYELALEATRRPDLRRVLAGTGALLRRSVEAILGELGVSDPPRQAPLLIAYLDGLVFDQIAGVAARRLTRRELRGAVLAVLRSFTSS
jgi:DNA-binding transcriptional regulator YbjK